MKLMHITIHFEYSDSVEAILDNHEIRDFARYAMREGKDRDGKHYGTQVFPGNTTIYQAQVPDEKVDAIFEDLKAFKYAKPAHEHLEALVLPVEKRLE
ncbi:MAG: PG0541 family transporter-associated protein [Desulfobacterales bacterium]